VVVVARLADMRRRAAAFLDPFADLVVIRRPLGCRHGLPPFPGRIEQDPCPAQRGSTAVWTAGGLEGCQDGCPESARRRSTARSARLRSESACAPGGVRMISIGPGP